MSESSDEPESFHESESSDDTAGIYPQVPIFREEDVQKLKNVAGHIIIDTGPTLARCLIAMKKRFLKLLNDPSVDFVKWGTILIGGAGQLSSDDWDTLSDLLICGSQSQPACAKVFFGRGFDATFPLHFIASIRQRAFDLHFWFREYRDQLVELSLISSFQNPTHTPISPFSIRAIALEKIADVAHIDTLVRLGRSGPEQVKLAFCKIFERRNWGTADTLIHLLEGNPWLSWLNHIDRPVVKNWGWNEEPSEEDSAYEDEVFKRIDALHHRNELLRKTAREAATHLLSVARILYLSSLISPYLQQDPNNLTTSFLDPVIHPSATHSSALRPSRPLSSSSASVNSSFFPILSLPYEILDIILSQLSPGCLSSSQHRIVMNWAEDRSTLGANKADSRTAFLRRTNCWRWESEIERVNLGYGYE